MHAYLAFLLEEVLKMYIILQLSYNNVNKYKYEICHLTKFQKLPFTHSHKRITTLFELLYIGLWVSHVIAIVGAPYYSL